MKILSKNEMKNIRGGSGAGCCYHDADWNPANSQCGLSRADAIDGSGVSGDGIFWCCSSCNASAMAVGVNPCAY
jgi:hypothetical protein